jgi:hypothetical protein
MNLRRPGPDPSKDADHESAFLGASRARVAGQSRPRIGFSRGIDALANRGVWAGGAGIDRRFRVGLPLYADPMSVTARPRAASKYPLFPP